MESEDNFSPISSYLFSARLGAAELCQREASRTWTSLVRENAAGRTSDREMEPTGTRVRHRRNSERFIVRKRREIVMTVSALDD